MASLLLFGAVVGAVGGGRIWNRFNRGQDAAGIASASGRTEIWDFVIRYCIKHPQGMGYVAGFRILYRNYWELGQQVITSRIGGAHNNYLQVLADAGWLALAVYLIMLIKIVRLALRFTKQQPLSRYAPDRESRDALRCWLLLLIYCFVDGMDSSDMMIPMWPSYYWQYIIIAIILGISARMIAASRARHLIMAK
jgi:O-antigen ligase